MRCGERKPSESTTFQSVAVHCRAGSYERWRLSNKRRQANAGLGSWMTLGTGCGAQVAAGEHDRHFPIDIFQTGSGTSSNMNANEVIARLAARAAPGVHPNDHVNMGQSSNDVIPSAIHVSAALLLREDLLPALAHLAAIIARREAQTGGIVKTGRTHLMDAMPVTLAQELSGWRTQIEHGASRLRLPWAAC